MTAPTMTMLHAVHAGLVAYDHEDHAYVMRGRSLSVEEYDELIGLRTDGLVFFPEQPTGRLDVMATTASGRRVMGR